jgi:hypothetical protein
MGAATGAGPLRRIVAPGAAAHRGVPRTGRSRGSFRVNADGFFQRTVKTYSATTGYRLVVYAMAWPDAGTHAVKIRVNGTSGHPRVDLDGIITLE